MTQYFYDCATKEEAKKKYRDLAKKLHPDRGGSKESFQDMQKQYDQFNKDDSFREGDQNWFKENYEKERNFHNFKFNTADIEGTQFYGRGFYKFYNSNAYSKTNRDIPFDHPIHAEMGNLRAAIKRLEQEAEMVERFRKHDGTVIVKLSYEIAELRKNYQFKDEQIQSYEKIVSTLNERVEYWREKACTNTFWGTIKKWITKN